MHKLSAHELLNCYAHGIFPMSDGRDSKDIFFVEPELRGVFPLDMFKISRSLAKIIRQRKFEIRINTAFAEVMQKCAAPRSTDSDTWINEEIYRLYNELHELSHAHSVECWQDNKLVGGLYGVHLGAAFFGESMFSNISNASKVALAHLIGRLRAGKFILLDTQFLTPHLQSLGAVEIKQEDYLEILDRAIKLQSDFFPHGFSDSDFASNISSGLSRDVMPWQSKTQIS